MKYYLSITRNFYKMCSNFDQIILKNNNKLAEELNLLKKDLESTKNDLISLQKENLRKENKHLKGLVQKLKTELIHLEIQNGKQQIPIPGEDDMICNVQQLPENVITPSQQETNVEQKSQSETTKPKVQKEKKKSKTSVEDKNTDDVPVHVGLLDMRIGKIIEIDRHPEADSLYLEKIDCGETNPRTVISGLVKFVPIDEMKERMVVVLCNLKPAKMRGIVSEAMVMCASTPDKVEVLSPPVGSVAGDLVHCEGYDRQPPVQLNPKKKIFEAVAVDLKTNSNLVACYKDSPLFVPGKGNIVAQTLKNVNIK